MRDHRGTGPLSSQLSLSLSLSLTHTHTVVVLQEVISLVHSHGLTAESPAGRGVGYRQALEWLRDTWGFPDPNRTKPYTPKVCVSVYEKEIFATQIPRDELQKSFLSFLFTYKARTR